MLGTRRFQKTHINIRVSSLPRVPSEMWALSCSCCHTLALPTETQLSGTFWKHTLLFRSYLHHGVLSHQQKSNPYTHWIYSPELTEKKHKSASPNRHPWLCPSSLSSHLKLTCFPDFKHNRIVTTTTLKIFSEWVKWLHPGPFATAGVFWEPPPAGNLTCPHPPQFEAVY